MTPEPMKIPTIHDWDQAPAWYDANAEIFASQSSALTPSPMLERLLDGLASDARVLDAGCGAGRDLAAMVSRGFRPTGLDASLGMLAAADRLTGGRADFRLERLQDFADPPASWDAIWCMAALLHCPLESHEAILTALLASLRDRGRLFVSVKSGAGEAMDARGRPFAFATAGDLAGRMRRATPRPHQIDAWTETASASSGAATIWSCALLTLS